MTGVWHGPQFIMTHDGPLMRIERIDKYDQRIAGERKVSFVARDGTVLKETTMDRFLVLMGEKR